MSLKCNVRKKAEVLEYEKELYQESKKKASHLARLYFILDHLKEDYYDKANQAENTHMIKKNTLKTLIDRYQNIIDEYNYLPSNKKHEAKEKLDQMYEEASNFDKYNKKLMGSISYFYKKSKNAERIVDKKAYEALYNIHKNMMR